MSKITLKNQLVYQFFKENVDGKTDVKEVYNAHADEIAERFQINNYATFNMHVRKCRDYEAKGNKLAYMRLDSLDANNG